MSLSWDGAADVAAEPGVRQVALSRNATFVSPLALDYRKLLTRLSAFFGKFSVFREIVRGDPSRERSQMTLPKREESSVSGSRILDRSYTTWIGLAIVGPEMDRRGVRVLHTRAQDMFDLPPAPELTVLRRLDQQKATAAERRGERLFLGQANGVVCHPAPFDFDDKMHDLHLERFCQDERGDGPNVSFTLRRNNEGPAYLHDGRCLILEDTVEWFNIVVEAEPARRRGGAPGRVLEGTLIARRGGDKLAQGRWTEPTPSGDLHADDSCDGRAFISAR